VKTDETTKIYSDPLLEIISHLYQSTLNRQELKKQSSSWPEWYLYVRAPPNNTFNFTQQQKTAI